MDKVTSSAFSISDFYGSEDREQQKATAQNQSQRELQWDK